MYRTWGIGLYAPAGFAQDPVALTRAVARLEALGHRVVVDPTRLRGHRWHPRLCGSLPVQRCSVRRR